MFWFLWADVWKAAHLARVVYTFKFLMFRQANLLLRNLLREFRVDEQCKQIRKRQFPIRFLMLIFKLFNFCFIECRIFVN